MIVPWGLAYGADGTLFAGNYEFENNEGNAVAIPPGANAPARIYAVPYGTRRHRRRGWAGQRAMIEGNPT